MKLNRQIASFFKNNGLSLTEKGQSISRSNAAQMAELRALIAPYQKETRIPIKCVCQSSINDFLILLQKYVKDNPIPEKKQKDATNEPDNQN